MKRDTDKNYWFKRRRYGYGWTPVTWEGWLTVVLFLAVAIFGAMALLGDTPRGTLSVGSLIYLVLLACMVILVMVTSLVKGPKPKWRWGSKSTDDPNEDF